MSVCAAYFVLEFDDVLVSEISVVHFVSHVKVYLEDERKVGFPFRVTFCDFSGRGLLYLRVFENGGDRVFCSNARRKGLVV